MHLSPWQTERLASARRDDLQRWAEARRLRLSVKRPRRRVTWPLGELLIRMGEWLLGTDAMRPSRARQRLICR